MTSTLGRISTRSPNNPAIDCVRRNVTWGPEFGNSPFFAGEVEPCINGRVVALGAYFGERCDALVDQLLREQLADGGWNCEAERGSVRSSFHTTICVLEGLLAFEHAFGATALVTDARDVLRALDYLRAASVQPDARVEQAIATVIGRRHGDGRWRLDVRHRDTPHEQMAGKVGEPNRWITWRALRVLDWYAGRE